MLIPPSRFARLCRVRARLHECHDALPVCELAAQVGLSQFQLIREFHALFGETPHQLRIRARIERAKRMLALDRASVTTICMDIGFSSLGSFSSAFARRVGTSPSEYRRRIRPRIQVPGQLPPALVPGCLSLLAGLPPGALRNSREA